MPVLATATLRRVDAVLNYLAEDTAHPGYVMPGAAADRPPPSTAKYPVTIHDLRDAALRPSLDDNGFTFLTQPTRTLDFFDHHAVSEGYFAECAALVRAITGAREVLAFDYNLRDKSLARQTGAGVSEPVRFVHNDYTEHSAPLRVRDLYPAHRHDELLARRFTFINVWRPLRAPVRDIPLAVCDATSIAPTDLVATELRYAERLGEVYSVRYNPQHRWYYQAELRPDEALLLKCFDSDTTIAARYTAHCAFHDPSAPPDSPPRRSIEVRTIAFF